MEWRNVSHLSFRRELFRIESLSIVHRPLLFGAVAVPLETRSRRKVPEWLFPRSVVSVHGVERIISELAGDWRIDRHVVSDRFGSAGATGHFRQLSPTTLCIPSSIKTIGESCFRFSRGISVVAFEFGAQVSSIDRSAFHFCPRLASLRIPACVQMLCDHS
jgi:hypothetical protein